MVELNLPECDCRVKQRDDGSPAIWDRLRERWVSLTPEEWVRQHFVAWLIADRQFPAALMGNEVSLYKAPTVKVTQKTFDQIVRYNMVLHARYLIVSNGLEHYCCRIDYATGSYRFLENIPCYADLQGP